MAHLTRPPREALYKLYEREYRSPATGGWDIFKPTYMSFRRSVQPTHMDGCVMKDMGWAWVGIETDGYTHT